MSATNSRRLGDVPVIALIILIAIAVVASVALSGWVFGLTKRYTRGVGVTIIPSASSCSLSKGCTIVLSNQGDDPVRVVSIYVGEQRVGSYTLSPTTQLGPDAIQPHAQATLTFSLQGLVGLSPEQSVEIHVGLDNGNTVSTMLTLTA